MLQSFLDALRGNAELFRSYPVYYTIGLIIAVTVIYFKWRWIAQAQKKALAANFEGWSTNAETNGSGVLIMRPIRMRSTAIWGLAFFGGGALYMGFFAEPDPNEILKHWFTVATMSGFSFLGLCVLFLSFDRILFDETKIVRTRLFTKHFVADLIDIESVGPLQKTIAGGVRLNFKDGRLLKVRARMTGYQQLLTKLAERDLKLRLLLNARNQQIRGSK